MKLQNLQKPIYNISAVIFLVLALGLISIITSVINKNSEKLSNVVTNLAENKFEIDKIDEAIQLLYKAENNSRLYVLTKDNDKYTEYLNQLNRVSSLILSIQKDSEEQIGGLVRDKKNKTEIYINAKLLADSLIKLESKKPQAEALPKAPVQITKSLNTITEEKTVEESVVENKRKRKLFSRLKDAIVNKPNDGIKSVTTTKDQTLIESKEDEVVVQPVINHTQNNHRSLFDKLTEKEKALLVANNLLFNELKGLLESLKEKETEIHKERQLSLGNNAAVLMSNLKSNNKYNLILSLLLTVVILGVLVLLYKNMQALQKAKLKAEEYAKYKSEFVATLSHEIRTPLHSIHAFTDELSKGEKKNGESEIIDAIKLSSSMLISVVNNVLDFTKMEKGKFKLNKAPFNPSVVIQEVILGLTIQAKRKNLIFIKILDDSTDRKIYGDAFQFRQILINIISNAIKYSEKGTITIAASFNTSNDANGVLEIKINDTGIGISSDRLPKIFNEYNSQANNPEIKEGSTGLGLSIVKRIVDYHQGEIKVDSKLGKGTSFTIKLPYQTHVEESIDLASDAKNKSLNKILIVENDQLNIKILNLLFVNENYIISNAFNGNEALENHIQNDYDLIITDISMPGLSGVELARKIRELSDPKKSSVPIIALTGFEQPVGFQDDKQSDINAWITKPFEKDKLLLEIDKLCN